MKFKVGERYKVTKDCFPIGFLHSSYTELGNIIEIETVRNDNDVYYSTVGKRKNLSCFEVGSFFANGLKPIHEHDKIVITTDGRTTTAKMYDGKKLVDSAKAICSPDDEFDFNLGATIALERLTGHVHGQLENTLEETWYNGKVVCVDNRLNEALYTLGKIYEFKDDYMINNDNLNSRFRNFKEFMNFTASKFIEVVE